MVLHSYAKLNLYLEVLAKRKDSYHNIKTLFERIDLSDEIIISPRSDKSIKICCRDSQVPQDNSNLCYRSARLMQKSFCVLRGVDIKIIKRIPVGAGLGGGSGNAAAVLVGLNKLWKMGLSINALVNLAKKIGCDVPFFIYNTPFALGQERGDKIKPLGTVKDARLWHILIVPRIKVSTPLIYRKWDEYSSLKHPKRRDILSKNNYLTGLTRPLYDVNILNLALGKNNLSLLGKALFNDLESISSRLYPQVRRIREKLESSGIKAILMSGSGPAVFGIVSSRKEAESLGRQLKKENKSWRVFVTRTF